MHEVLCGPGSVFRGDDADTRRSADRGSEEGDRGPERRSDSRLEVFVVADEILEENGELVPAEPRDQIMVTHAAADPATHSAQHRIAGRDDR